MIFSIEFQIHRRKRGIPMSLSWEAKRRRRSSLIASEMTRGIRQTKAEWRWAPCSVATPNNRNNRRSPHIIVLVSVSSPRVRWPSATRTIKRYRGRILRRIRNSRPHSPWFSRIPRRMNSHRKATNRESKWCSSPLKKRRLKSSTERMSSMCRKWWWRGRGRRRDVAWQMTMWTKRTKHPIYLRKTIR